jgi:hypothetical protein
VVIEHSSDSGDTVDGDGGDSGGKMGTPGTRYPYPLVAGAAFFPCSALPFLTSFVQIAELQECRRISKRNEKRIRELNALIEEEERQVLFRPEIDGEFYLRR